MRPAKRVKRGATAKASVNSATLSYRLDPKPGELAMGRVNAWETKREARTSTSCNAFG